MPKPYAPLALSLFRGEDYVGEGTHRVSPAFGAEAENITGWSILVTLKETADDDEDPVLTANATLTTPSAGQYAFTFSAAQTAELGVQDYVIDVWRVNDGSKTLLAKGKLTVRQPVRTPA